MKKQIKSFHYAFRGILYTILHEGHFRFHLVAAGFVIFFAAKFYNFDKVGWCVLMLTISLVLSLECVNTAIERACNKITEEYDKTIMIAKDVSAASVLVAAVFAATVAVFLFWDIKTFTDIFNYYKTHILNLVLLLIAVIISILFIALFKSKNKN